MWQRIGSIRETWSYREASYREALLLSALLSVLLLAACSDDEAATPNDGGSTAGEAATGGDRCDALDPAFSVPGSDVGERYACISLPEPDALVSGTIEVGGYSAGAFEQALVVELRDASGSVLVTTPVTARAPDLGLVGPWTATLALPPDTPSGVGTIVAYATSARDGSVDFEATITVRIIAAAG